MDAVDAWSYGFGGPGSFDGHPHAVVVVGVRTAHHGREYLGPPNYACDWRGDAHSTAYCLKVGCYMPRIDEED
jgi:hypothetical protein